MEPLLRFCFQWWQPGHRNWTHVGARGGGRGRQQHGVREKHSGILPRWYMRGPTVVSPCGACRKEKEAGAVEEQVAEAAEAEATGSKKTSVVYTSFL